MKLQEKHKEFVVKKYACFMKIGTIVENFMTEFAPDIAQSFIETTPERMREELAAEILSKKESFTEEHSIITLQAPNIYKKKLREAPSTLEDKSKSGYLLSINWSEITKRINDYNQRLKHRFSNSFRRLNITHPQFPEKYRQLFNKTREEYLANYRTTNLSIPENVILELELLYGLTKELALENRDPKHISQAVQILKTIAACNAINAQDEPVDITPEDVKTLQDTGKTLTNQLKKETKRLDKHTENGNA